MEDKVSNCKELEEVEPDRDYGKIAIRIIPPLSEEKARKVIDEMRISVFDTEYVSEQVVIFKLNTKDVKAVIFSLAINGFVEIKGFDAQHT